MRKIILFLSFYFLFISTLLAQYPDTIIVETTKIKGTGPFPLIFYPFQEMNKDNPWISTIPEYKGIPTDLEHLMFATESADFLQHTYQNYISGKISEERFNELKESWNWKPNESEYSKEFIKVDIGIIAGYDSTGTLKIKIDRNNNYDFSDDEDFTLPEIKQDQNWNNRYNDSLLIEVSYEYFDGEKKIGKTWMYLDFQMPQIKNPQKIMSPIKLVSIFAEHQFGKFEVNGEKYNLAIKSDRIVFRDFYSAIIWNEKDKNIPLDVQELIDKNGFIKIGQHWYKLGKANIDGSQVQLIKYTDVEKRGGNEVGMNAINFVSESINGEIIELEKLKGNIVYLDFWGSWCSPCREEIPKLKSIYEKYKNKNFKVIGIANDKLEDLQTFIKENNIEWPQILQEKDKSILIDYNIFAYPTTFLLDTNGKIIAKNIRARELSDKLADLYNNK